MQVLGEGNFGKVWKAEVDDICGYEGTILVAVKGVKVGVSYASVCCLCLLISRFSARTKNTREKKTNAIANCADINAVLCISVCFEAALQLSLWNKEDF